MPRKLPPYVEINRVRGHVYLSFRRGKGTRIRLPNDPDSIEFKKAYAAALAGDVVTLKAARREVVKPGTIAALIADYMKHGTYRGLRATTKKGYASRLETLRTKHGHRTVSGMTRAGIQTKILDPYADRPGAAHSLLKMLRVLVAHAILRDWIKTDPTAGIKRPKLGEIRSWTDAEIAQFERRWPIGTKQRLAFALMLFTGQRRSDVHRMTWADIDGGVIQVVQQKTGAKVWVPMHGDLAAVLAAAPREHVTILNTAYGKPFTVAGFGRFFTVAGFGRFMRDAITAAGLPLGAQPHGLRKAAARRLAEAGCGALEIMSITGHTTLAEVERYVREANRKGLAVTAVTKLADHTANRLAQTDPKSFGEIAKTSGK